MSFARVYNAAADHYDDPVNGFWDRCSLRTLERLAPSPGARLLDAGCGTGAFSIPAAVAVGPAGLVVGQDLAGNLLTLARRKAAASGLRNVCFEERDAFDGAADSRAFDAAVSIFSLFFAADMIAAIRALCARVRPGGTIAVTTWAPGVFEPAASAFWSSVTSRRPDLRPATLPWDRLSHPAALHSVMASAGVEDIHVVAEPGGHDLETPDDWWSIALGSGFRGVVDALTPLERQRVHGDTLERLCRANVRTIRVDAVYALGRTGPTRADPIMGGASKGSVARCLP
jgi:2-polyprenyl-3-methyl-5-hydroxy-6-metoxy-1,4-benzoquinol methylase